MTLRSAIWLTLIACVFAAVWSADEAAATVQLVKALFSLDVQVGG